MAEFFHDKDANMQRNQDKQDDRSFSSIENMPPAFQELTERFETTIALNCSCPETLIIIGLSPEEINTALEALNVSFSPAALQHLSDVSGDPALTLDADFVIKECESSSVVHVERFQLYSLCDETSLCIRNTLSLTTDTESAFPFLKVQFSPAVDCGEGSMNLRIDWDVDKMIALGIGYRRWEPLQEIMRSLEDRELPPQLSKYQRVNVSALGENLLGLRMDDRTILSVFAYEEMDASNPSIKEFVEVESRQKKEPQIAEKFWRPMIAWFNEISLFERRQVISMIGTTAKELEASGGIDYLLDVVRGKEHLDLSQLSKCANLQQSCLLERKVNFATTLAWSLEQEYSDKEEVPDNQIKDNVVIFLPDGEFGIAALHIANYNYFGLETNIQVPEGTAVIGIIPESSEEVSTADAFWDYIYHSSEILKEEDRFNQMFFRDLSQVESDIVIERVGNMTVTIAKMEPGETAPKSLQ